MKKFTVLVMMLALCVTTVLAQAHFSASARVAIAEKQLQSKARAAKSLDGSIQQQYLTLVLRIDQATARDTYNQIREAGAIIKSKIGNLTVVSMPLDKVDQIAAIKGVRSINAIPQYTTKTDVTREVTGVNLLNGLNPKAEMPVSGKGVTLCIIDTGFDYQHPAFKDAEGRTRIKCVYLQKEKDGNKYTASDATEDSGSFTFPGSIYDTPELIAKLTTDDFTTAHGTHTAAIAAGTLSSQGFGGMAPDADIILIPVESSSLNNADEDDDDKNDDDILTALRFAQSYALKNNLKMVVSCSMGSHVGPHNGTSDACLVLDSISNDVISVFSAGNEGADQIHIYKHFSANDSTLNVMMNEITDEVKGCGATLYTRSSIPATTKVTVKASLLNAETHKVLWETPSVPVTASMIDKDLKYVISSEKISSLNKYFSGTLLMGAGKEDNGQVGAIFQAQGVPVDDDICFTFSAVCSNDIEIDIWSSVSSFEKCEGYETGDSKMSGSDFGTAKNVISVGAYNANLVERTYNGKTTEDGDMLASLSDIDDIALFSSYGEFLNGVKQPTVCAPGTFVVSAWNHYNIPATDKAIEKMTWQDYPYGSMSGTSMACPVVSGIIALWLEANPNLKLADVKKILAESSINDQYTANKPIYWGYGKINASKGIEIINNGTTTISSLNDDTRSDNGVLYDLQGRSVTRPNAGFYIKGGKKVLFR